MDQSSMCSNDDDDWSITKFSHLSAMKLYGAERVNCEGNMLQVCNCFILVFRHLDTVCQITFLKNTLTEK